MNTTTFAPPASLFHSFAPVPTFSKGAHLVVVGAGAFGGWTALYLLRQGFKVTLVDAWGAGNSRSSSGDETRVIRSTYGANAQYFALNVRALELWKENQRAWGKKLFFNTGVLWMCYQPHNPIVDDSIPFAEQAHMPYERLSTAELATRFPILNTSDLTHAFFDPFGGYLKARESCMAVFDAFLAEGGAFIQSMVETANQKGNRFTASLQNGNRLTADGYLFACGPWMGQLFNGFLNATITCTRQEAYYFGVPAKEAQQFDQFPVWVDLDGTDFYYGIPGNANRGFKVGVDKRGSEFEPTSGDRMLNPEVLSPARKFMAHRFPSLQNAPISENRVCPYESTPDGNFVFSGHPQHENVVFLGGGSGHGFKHGPAVGEWVAKELAGGSF